MYKDKKILAVTMARGGSKGIPRKNIKELAGQPLIAYTIKTALGSKFLDAYAVSSDDEEIIGIARHYGADAPFVRPAELAEDQTPDIPVLQHALNWFKEERGREFDYIMMLHPTAPLRLPQHIDEAIAKIADTGADSVMGMRELEDFALPKLKRIENDLILPLLADEGAATARRQDEKIKVFKRNCAIYLTKTELIMQGDMFGKISRPYLMGDEWALDINHPYDFEIGEFKLKKLREKGYEI